MKTPFIQYEQFLLNKNFIQYIETIIISTKILRMGIQKTPLQKTYEMYDGSQNFNVDFLGSNRQFDWLDISLFFNKSDKHRTIYDSYNVEKVAQGIQSVEVENISKAYSLTNTMKFDVSNDTQKHMLYKQFVAWNCNGCSIGPLTDYVNNPVYQELPEEDIYFSSSDGRIYINLRDTRGYTNEMEKPIRNDSKLVLKIELKDALAKKMRLEVWGYSMGKYLYMLTGSGLTLKYKTSAIRTEDDLEE